MTKKTLVFVVIALLVSSFSMSQNKPSAGQAIGLPGKQLMQEVNDAWATLDPDNAAKYYDKSPKNVFFDIAPLKYNGFPAYIRGAREVFTTLQSMKYTVGNNAVVHFAGNIAWGTATLNLEMIDKQGRKVVLDLRWTPVWEKKRSSWLLVHEHLSAPIEPRQH